MKKNIFRNIVFAMILTQWSVAPLAQASELNNIRKAQMNQVLADLGYNTKQRRYTVDEIWTTTKYLFNEKDRDYLDRWVAYNGDQLMPKVDVTEQKDKSGDLQYRWTVQGPEGIVTLTFIGEDDQFLKIDDRVFSKMEVYEQIPVVTGMSDKKIAKKAEAQLNELVKVSAPRLITSDWVKMTPEQRAEYLIEVRKMLMSSVDVLEGSGKKTAKRYLQKFDLWYSEFVKNAQAEKVGDNCIVAGYVGQYQNGPHLTGTGQVVKSGLHCSVAHAQTVNGETLSGPDNAEISSYKDNKSGNIYAPQRKAFGVYNSQCSGSNGPMVSCNPYVFGMNTDGKPHCISMSNSSFSTATKQCDTSSPLNSIEDTKKMISGMLKSKEDDSGLADFLNCPNKDNKKCVQNTAMIEKLQNDIVKPFSEYINSALKLCGGSKKSPDKNQDSACETLRLRKLSFEQNIKSIRENLEKLSPGSVAGNPPAGKPEVKPPGTETKPQGPKPGAVVVAPDTPPVGATSPQAGTRLSKPAASQGICTEYKFACIGTTLFVSAIAGIALLRAQARSLNINTPTYVPPAVNGCPSNWIQTGSSAATCYPPNYTSGTTSTPVPPPAPLTSTTTTTPSGGATGGSR